eukprot:TRINITY_DN3679_c0_g1_i1.p1 TRINITY_DN3679_c0_g1~~TRINITY_DN3679_c0_g1_i1.p1  ORF type:complete len:566 (-),score=116.25 TRINITY_DN3679_c0_g1_i1:18-1652(-)
MNLSEIISFDKSSLKHTETKVTESTSPVVISSPSKKLGHEEELEILEYFDNPEIFRQSCIELAHMIRDATSVVVYTGAGISTSAKIPDYRGPDGVWTNRDRGTRMDRSKYTTIEHAIPTLAHMAIAELVNRDLVRLVVSTNVDGLHMRSGLTKEHLSELHGNCYLEVCDTCSKEYLRPYDVMKTADSETRSVHRHFSGRYCEVEGCNGLLLDSIIHFGESLPVDELERSFDVSSDSDLAIVLGTSMKVRPACEIPSRIYQKSNGKMVLCNLQKTPFDRHAELIVRGYIDDIFKIVMEELDIEIPMTTPEGYDIPEYVDDIEERHTRKIAETEEKERSIKQKMQKGRGKTGVIDLFRKMKGSNSIANREGETSVLEGFQKRELIEISNCHNCIFHIEDQTTKVIITDCDGCEITINDRIMTSVVELIGCNNITITLNVPALTLTVDRCNTVDVIYGQDQFFRMIVFNQVEELNLTIENQVIAIPDISTLEKNIDITQDQFIVRYVDDEVLTEKIYREEGGYLTTRREIEANKCQAQINASQAHRR